MIQNEGLRLGCVCPACLTRCSACMGTDTVVPREALGTLALRHFSLQKEPDAGEEELFTGPLRPEEILD